MKITPLLVAAGVAVAVGALAARTSRPEGDPKEAVAQKMRQCLESLPEHSPPRMLFDNVAASRANTERILEILDERDAPDAAMTASDQELAPGGR